MKNLFSLKRIGSRKYLLYALAFIFLFRGLYGVLILVVMSNGPSNNILEPQPLSSWLSYIDYIGVVLWASLSVKRLHDMDFSGFWIPIILIPCVVLGIANPQWLAGGWLGLMILPTILLAIESGTPGPNRFGEDPLQPKI